MIDPNWEIILLPMNLIKRFNLYLNRLQKIYEPKKHRFLFRQSCPGLHVPTVLSAYLK